MRSKWQLSCECKLQESWPATSPTLGDRAEEERKREIEAKENKIEREEKGMGGKTLI